MDPNIDGTVVTAERLENHQPPGIKIQRDSVVIGPDIETCDPYFKLKLLVEELLVIFTKRGEKCGICVEYIVKLCQHIGQTHDDHLTTTNITETDSCSNNHFPSQNIMIPTNGDDGDVERSSNYSNESAISVAELCDTTRPDTDEFPGDDEDETVSVSLRHTKKPKRCLERYNYKEFGTTRPFECEECGIGFSKRINLKKHRQIHTKQNPFKCYVCDAGFPRKENLYPFKHIRSGKKSIKCNACRDCNLLLGGHLEIQDKYKNDKREKILDRFQCLFCGRDFGFKSVLVSHKLTIHTGEKSFKCHKCGKCFRSFWDLRVHKNRENWKREKPRPKLVIKPHKCRTCGKLVQNSRDLRSHKSNIPFKCGLCGKEFFFNCHLTKHRVKHMHTGDERFKCDVCGEGYCYVYI